MTHQEQRVVKVIWHKTASLPHTDGSIVFARWHQCPHPCGHIGATWQIWLNLCFLRPTRVHIPNGKSIGSDVYAQLMAESPYTLQRVTLSPKLPLPMGGFGRPCNSWLFGPFWDHNPNDITINSAIFTQVVAYCPYTLLWAPLYSKIALSHGGSGSQSNAWFFGPIRAHNPNGISSGSAVFAQLTAECSYTLQWDVPSPLKISPSHGSWVPPESSTQTASRSV